MKVPIYNMAGEQVREMELSDAVFGARWNPALIRQVVLAHEANRREPVAHAKTRGEVRGGGKKPWRQKHTGRARHGSIRSPIWKGGGVSHGPRNERRFDVRVNAQARRLALHVALSRKLREGSLRIVDTFPVDPPKTKTIAGALKAYPAALLVAGKGGAILRRITRNIPKVASVAANSLNAYDALRHRSVLIEERAVADIK